MSSYGRAVRGVEAGVLAAGVVEVSFFLLDLIRLRPLSTPLALAGLAPGPTGVVVDATTMTGILGVLWALYQVVLLTIVHFAAFGLVGLVAALAFDWSRLGVGRLAGVAALCTLAFYLTVALSGSVLALGAIGYGTVVGMNLLAAVVLGGALYLVQQHDAPTEGEADGPT